jgi:Ca2+-binding EF-hand superfamily protein
MANLQAWFNSVDRDRSGSITATELATLPFGGRQLGIQVATRLIRVFDQNYSGSIDFPEYAALNQFLVKLYNAFCASDQDRSGYLDYREIFNALVGAGFDTLTFETVQAVCQKYDTTRRGLNWEQFLLACAHLATVRSIFDWNDKGRTGKVTFSYDQMAMVCTHLIGQ